MSGGAPARTAAEEVDALRRPFLVGCLFAVIAMLGVAGLLSVVNHGHDRPEGRAEQFLNAVSDSTRAGLRDEAVREADELGGFAIGAPLLPADDTEGRSAFPDLEVGRARTTGAAGARTARVPYELHQRASKGDNPTKLGTVVLVEEPGGGWKVTALVPREADEEVPGEGGDPPARINPLLWLVAILVGVGVTFVCALLVRLAGREAEASVASAAP